jgi:hypothetical protein
MDVARIHCSRLLEDHFLNANDRRTLVAGRTRFLAQNYRW